MWTTSLLCIINIIKIYIHIYQVIVYINTHMHAHIALSTLYLQECLQHDKIFPLFCGIFPYWQVTIPDELRDGMKYLIAYMYIYHIHMYVYLSYTYICIYIITSLWHLMVSVSVNVQLTFQLDRSYTIQFLMGSSGCIIYCWPIVKQILFLKRREVICRGR
jgi:hypothetical protein